MNHQDQISFGQVKAALTPSSKGKPDKYDCPVCGGSSLAIEEGESVPILAKCWSGCVDMDTRAYFKALMSALFPDSPAPAKATTRRAAPRPSNPPTSPPVSAYEKPNERIRKPSLKSGERITGEWTYLPGPSAEQQRESIVYRIEGRRGKKRFVCTPSNRGGLRYGPFLPLYWGSQPGAESVVIVEGEKCADRLRHLGYYAVTGRGGDIASVDIPAVLDTAPETVIVWPDNDEPGQVKAQKWIAALSAGGHPNVKAISVPKGKESTWDAADATDRECRALIAEAVGSAPAKTKEPLYSAREPVRAALEELGVTLRYNSRRVTIEAMDGLAGVWRTMPRAQLNEWQCRLAESYTDAKGKPWEVSQTRFDQLIDGIAYGYNRVDPFKQWLDSLPEWDGKGRLATWMFEIYETRKEERELVEWVGGATMCAAMWRTMEAHPVKIDEVPVLLGGPGIGKSTFGRAMLPDIPDAYAWFSDGLDFSADPKAMLEACLGKAIIEIQEMSGAIKADRAKVKSFLSREMDNSIRLAYDRDVVDAVRRFAIYGTADFDSPLPDDPNVRRWVPVRLAPKNGDSYATVQALRAYLNANREQMWAEARQRWIQRIEPRLPEHLRGSAETSAIAARGGDSVLADYWERHSADLVVWVNDAEGRTATEISQKIRSRYKHEVKFSYNQLAEFLKINGFKQAPGRTRGRIYIHDGTP